MKFTIHTIYTVLFLVAFTSLNAQVYEYPYSISFEYSEGNGGWSTGGNTSWERGDPHPETSMLDTGYAGFYCWITNIDGDYSNNEDGYIQSPTFDFSSLSIPKIEFSLWWYCQNEQDGAVLQYSIDDGLTWANVGAFGDENWFNYDNIEAQPGGQYEGWTGINDTGWDGNSGSGWKVMKHSLEDLAGQTQVEFRLYFASDGFDTSEGFAFDLFKVYDDALAYIPDVAFEQYLLDNLIDSDGVINGQVLKSDISSINTLDISGYNISNFSGLEHFTALTHFILNNNQSPNSYSINFGGSLQLLEEITITNTPNLGYVGNYGNAVNLTNLTVVTNGNNLTNIYLPASLFSANISQNSLYGVEISNNSELETLNISDNPIDQIEVTSLEALQVLEINQTEIKYLDLTNNSNLVELKADNTTLLEVKLNNGFNNLLTSVDLTNNPNLTCIQVDDPVYSNSAAGWDKDASTSYAEDCGFAIRDFPYAEDFENGNAGWEVVNVSNSSWELGIPSSSNLNTAASGSYAWVTNVTGNHNSNENGWVLSPEFNFSSFDGYDQLYVSFDTWYNTESDADGVVLQSSIDGGSTWQIVGDLDDEYSINQYTNNSISGNPGGQSLGWSGISENLFSNGWKKTVFNIGSFTDGSLVGELNVLFRIAFGSNGSIENDGFAFDNFRISQNSCYAGEDAIYNNICTVNENGNYLYRMYLSSYLVGTYGGGNWTSLDGLAFADEFEDSIDPQQIPQSGTYRFKYTNCSNNEYSDESIIELNIERKLLVGLNSEYFDNNTSEGCSELTFETPEAFQQWAFDKHVADNTNTVDPGGTWTPNTFEGYGSYTYTQPATTYCPETSAVFLYNKQDPIETYEYIQASSDVTNLFVLIDDLQSNKNTEELSSFSRRGRWRSNLSSVSDDGEVDFPNTGTGPYYITHYIDYIVEDDCGSIESITHYRISVFGSGNGGEDGLLSICEGETFTEDDLFNALGGNPSNVGYWSPEINGPGDYKYVYEEFQGLEEQFWGQDGGTVSVVQSPLLKLSVLLQGPYNPNTGWMNNKLVTNNLIPTISPYSDALELPVFSSFSQDIVDWVWIELRDAANQTNIALSRSALLKRNGDVVDTDGHKPIICDIPDGDYYLKVNHRNHLGVISANPINISCGSSIMDLRYDSSLVNGGVNAIKELDFGDIGLFAGDVNNDGVIQYSGATPEGPTVLSYVLNHPSNFLNLPTFSILGYSDTDIDMDGLTQYAGGNSEMPIILQNVLTNPANFLNLITWPIEAQLPETTD